ncbi:hypothetical protein J2792_004214 [Novosphingobium capsulatum]|uniref:Uncharacterized protein n=1 Tax=Novosphingobium capsulatum TaxID=13688 RepID=A0ABU1MTM1_9SPHN|nr:hypothetical protein [Novosphingobium capsulatum]MDR6513321.1 hypothetical protein [Novosphingobium capsulatum]
MAEEWAELFENFGTKIVSETDKDKGAYVPSSPQKYAMGAAGIEPSYGEEKATYTIGVLFDPALRSMQISYYNAERSGSGRSPEPRIGRGLVQWIETGDDLVIGNVGNRVFVAKEPIAPVGRAFLTDSNGVFLTDSNGTFLTAHVSPDLDELTEALEAGRPSLMGNPADLRRREPLIRQIAAVKDQLAELHPQHGGIGHNNPPADEDEETALDIIEETVEHLDAELAKEEPDAVQVGRAGRMLRNAIHWLGGKADLFAEEFVKAFGKSLGETAGKAIVGAAVLASLGALVTGVAVWLQAVSWPF